MDLGIYGKRALVTASTAGIGLAIAKSLASEGATVWINGRTQERVDAAMNEVQGQVHGVAADLSDAKGSEKLFESLSDLAKAAGHLQYLARNPICIVTG